MSAISTLVGSAPGAIVGIVAVVANQISTRKTLSSEAEKTRQTLDHQRALAEAERISDREQAAEERTWHRKVEMYIDLLDLLSTLTPEDFTTRNGRKVEFGRTPELKERIAKLRLDGRMAALGSPQARKIWDTIEVNHDAAAILHALDLGSQVVSTSRAIEKNMRTLENVIRAELGQKEYTDELRDM